uniref:Putative ovule protein n=1 Tax=Solanum chacoense TaxID=4108 RepID=A0A0V0I5R6_SOLCH
MTGRSEIQRVAYFFNTIEQFNGPEVGQDTLWWKGNKNGQFKVSNAYWWMNQTPQCISNWPWKGSWKNKIPQSGLLYLVASQGSSSYPRQSNEERDATLS